MKPLRSERHPHCPVSLKKIFSVYRMQVSLLYAKGITLSVARIPETTQRPVTTICTGQVRLGASSWLPRKGQHSWDREAGALSRTLQSPQQLTSPAPLTHPCQNTWLMSSCVHFRDLRMVSSCARPAWMLCSSCVSSCCSRFSSDLARFRSSSWDFKSDSWDWIWVFNDEI